MTRLWSNFTPNVLIIILGVVLVGVLLFMYRTSIEGFESNVTGVQEALSKDYWKDSAAAATVTAALGLAPPTDDRQYVAQEPDASYVTPLSGSAIASIVASLPHPSAATSCRDGPTPNVRQSSMVPSDTGAATSPNPLQSTPQPKDIAATMESLANFNQLATQKSAYTTNMTTADIKEVQKLQNMYPLFQNELLSAAADPTTTSLTVRDLDTFRNHLESVTHTLRGASMKGGVDYSGNNNLSSVVTTVATPSNTLNMNDLQNLKQRIDAESLKLTNLRSSSTTITKRKNQLDSISSDLNDMIVKLQNKRMKPEDIPIQQDAANAFLASIGETARPIPTLIQPVGTHINTSTKPTAASVMSAAAAPGGNAALTQLINNAQYLKWNIDVSVGFDPKAALRGRMLDRLEQIEKTLTNLVISETPPTPQMFAIYRKEMETIQKLLDSQVSNTSSTVIIDTLPTTYTRFDTDMQEPIENETPTSNSNRSTSESTPAYVPADGALANGRVSMMGPDRVNSDGRVQLRTIPTPRSMGRHDSNYGMATPSDDATGIYTARQQPTQSYTPPSNTMFALPISYGAITSDSTGNTPSSFNAQPSYNTTPTVAPNVNAMYTPPPTVTVPVYMTAYTPAIPGVSATAAGAQTSQPAGFVPTASTPGLTQGMYYDAYAHFLNTLLSNETDPTKLESIRRAIKDNKESISIKKSLADASGKDWRNEHMSGFEQNYTWMQKVPPSYNYTQFVNDWYARGISKDTPFPGPSGALANLAQPRFDPSNTRVTVTEGFVSPFPNAGPQPDSKIRPGYAMNDESIARRASASAFDPSTVGGPDYKQRAQDLCNQVGQADLAPPKNFGCIANPDEVGPDYSWKGNYQMICNRLGDTWGGWYPEMVGCPPSNPTAKFQGQ